MVIISRAFWYFNQNVYYLHIYIEKCVCSVYNIIKGGKYETKRSCEKLKNAGFHLVRHGGDHDVYQRGNDEEVIPRHKEVNERLAKQY